MINVLIREFLYTFSCSATSHKWEILPLSLIGGGFLQEAERVAAKLRDEYSASERSRRSTAEKNETLNKDGTALRLELNDLKKAQVRVCIRIRVTSHSDAQVWGFTHRTHHAFTLTRKHVRMGRSK